MTANYSTSRCVQLYFEETEKIFQHLHSNGAFLEDGSNVTKEFKHGEWAKRGTKMEDDLVMAERENPTAPSHHQTGYHGMSCIACPNVPTKSDDQKSARRSFSEDLNAAEI